MEDETENGSRTVRGTRPARNYSFALSQLVQTLLRGRGKQMPHQGGSQETSISEVHMDFAFLGREDDPQKTMAVLVAKERTSKMIISAAAPRKTTGTYIAKRVAGFFREVGCLHGDMVVKSDQEPALRSIVEDVGRLSSSILQLERARAME